MGTFFIILAILLAIVLFAALLYNKMITLRNRVKEGWADIDVQLKRRYNLIPNLVETVKGYASHEQETFTKVTEARNMAINAGDIKSQGAAENMLSGALKSLFAVAESYPDLKANQNFLQLQNELVDTEDKIQAARRFYNGMVRDFNTLIQKFPNSIIAGVFSFKEHEFFELEDAEQRENVKVSFQGDPAQNPNTQITSPTPEVDQPKSTTPPSAPAAAASQASSAAPVQPPVATTNAQAQATPSAEASPNPTQASTETKAPAQPTPTTSVAPSAQPTAASTLNKAEADKPAEPAQPTPAAEAAKTPEVDQPATPDKPKVELKTEPETTGSTPAETPATQTSATPEAKEDEKATPAADAADASATPDAPKQGDEPKAGS